jgi:hypothetical protein
MAKQIVSTRVSSPMSPSLSPSDEKIIWAAQEDEAAYQVYWFLHALQGRFEILECLKSSKEEPNGSAVVIFYRFDPENDKAPYAHWEPWGRFKNPFLASAAIRKALQAEPYEGYRAVIDEMIATMKRNKEEDVAQRKAEQDAKKVALKAQEDAKKKALVDAKKGTEKEAPPVNGKRVASAAAARPSSALETHFAFEPGCRNKKRSTIVEQKKEQIERELRHNELQEALYRRLARRFGGDNVGTENQGANGTSIDLVVRWKRAYWFYEIKTGPSARACLREALGQLLEYAFWPGAQQASRLVVVGEAQLDKSGEDYLRCLRKRFRLPIVYEQITV